MLKKNLAGWLPGAGERSKISRTESGEQLNCLLGCENWSLEATQLIRR